MKIVEITGGIDSGKNRVLGILGREYDTQIIQADLMARELMEPGGTGYGRPVALYGDRILATDRTIDRPRMAALTFHDDEMFQTVNGITHSLVWASVHRQIEGFDSELVMMEAMLPDENHRDIYIESRYAYTSEENRMARPLEGRGYSREKTRSVMDSQLPEEGFRRMAGAVVDNNGSLEDTGRQIALLLK